MITMQENENETQERDPHFDGRFESIISDTTSMQGQQMGIRADVNPENMVQPKNPFHIKPKVDKRMQKFQDLFKGDK